MSIIVLFLTAMLAGSVVIIVVGIWRRVRTTPDQRGPFCGHCGYNLTGSTTNRCPECGKLFIEAGVLTRKAGKKGGFLLLGVLLMLLTFLGFFVLLFTSPLSSTHSTSAMGKRSYSAAAPARPTPTTAPASPAPTTRPTTQPAGP